MQDLARFSQMEKLLLLLLMMIKQTTRTVENDQDRLAVKNLDTELLLDRSWESKFFWILWIGQVRLI